MSVAIVPAVAENVVVVAPETTLTLAGTVRTEVLLEARATVVAAPGALVNVTVQVETPVLDSVAGEHASEDTRGGALREIEKD